MKKRAAVLEKPVPPPASRASAAPVVTAVQPAQASPSYESEIEAMIRLRAYQKWEEAGKPVGRDTQFWLQAEEELLLGKCPPELAKNPN